MSKIREEEESEEEVSEEKEIEIKLEQSMQGDEIYSNIQITDRIS